MFVLFNLIEFYFFIEYISIIAEIIKAIRDNTISPGLKHWVFNSFKPMNAITMKFINNDTILNLI